jgi:hypothetical protein
VLAGDLCRRGLRRSKFNVVLCSIYVRRTRLLYRRMEMVCTEPAVPRKERPGLRRLPRFLHSACRRPRWLTSPNGRSNTSRAKRPRQVAGLLSAARPKSRMHAPSVKGLPAVCVSRQAHTDAEITLLSRSHMACDEGEDLCSFPYSVDDDLTLESLAGRPCQRW